MAIRPPAHIDRGRTATRTRIRLEIFPASLDTCLARQAFSCQSLPREAGTACRLREEAPIQYELNPDKLREKAREYDDKSGHAIQQRTGINQTTVYGILRRDRQPDLNTAIRLSVTYDFDIRDVMDQISEPIKASA